VIKFRRCRPWQYLREKPHRQDVIRDVLTGSSAFPVSLAALNAANLLWDIEYARLAATTTEKKL
jgi:hypothetical protein